MTDYNKSTDMMKPLLFSWN